VLQKRSGKKHRQEELGKKKTREKPGGHMSLGEDRHEAAVRLGSTGEKSSGLYKLKIGKREPPSILTL